ncbi:hypothetical protein E8E13_001708 [Curvularia kusanoi]|uniref:Uncharacterized protein n=1 Tax=Curvularia kusanoi TaxID=90978 RepID=A0A9P4T3Y6_CURKU|nr:hypothetical protein E8E13_001708 [Curvularia kusanoi]
MSKCDLGILADRNKSKEIYTVIVEKGALDDPEVFLVLIKNERKSCLHIAATGTNTDIENAKAVCAQAIFSRTREHDPALYFAVYDDHAQNVYFFLFFPSPQEFEDVSQYSMRKDAAQVAEWLKTYTVSNAEVLS